MQLFKLGFNLLWAYETRLLSSLYLWILVSQFSVYLFQDFLFWFLHMVFCFLVCSVIVFLISMAHFPWKIICLPKNFFEISVLGKFSQKGFTFALAKCLEHYQHRQFFTMCMVWSVLDHTSKVNLAGNLHVRWPVHMNCPSIMPSARHQGIFSGFTQRIAR